MYRKLLKAVKKVNLDSETYLEPLFEEVFDLYVIKKALEITKMAEHDRLRKECGTPYTDELKTQFLS